MSGRGLRLVLVGCLAVAPATVSAAPPGDTSPLGEIATRLANLEAQVAELAASATMHDGMQTTEHSGILAAIDRVLAGIADLKRAPTSRKLHSPPVMFPSSVAINTLTFCRAINIGDTPVNARIDVYLYRFEEGCAANASGATCANGAVGHTVTAAIPARGELNLMAPVMGESQPLIYSASCQVVYESASDQVRASYFVNQSNSGVLSYSVELR